MAAEQATTEEAAAWALAWLSTRAGWLVVFDNVEEAADVEPHLARLARGHVLITTRRDISWPQRGITPLRLEVLDRPASIALLAGLIGPLATDQRPLLNELANQLGDLPLALAQAGAYIARTPGITPVRYLCLLSETPARMHAAAPAGGDAARAVAKVWTLSHARLQTLNPLSVRVLNVLSCYAPDDLPVTVLNGFDDADDVAVSEALALLASYSLITVTTSPAPGLSRAPEALVSVHRLVQAVTLDQLAPDQRERWRVVAADLLQNAVPPTLGHAPTGRCSPGCCRMRAPPCRHHHQRCSACWPIWAAVPTTTPPWRSADTSTTLSPPVWAPNIPAPWPPATNSPAGPG